MILHKCDRCLIYFSSERRLQSHQARLKPCKVYQNPQLPNTLNEIIDDSSSNCQIISKPNHTPFINVEKNKETIILYGDVTKKGYIYVMYNTLFEEDVYKIGRSKNCEKRLNSYVTSYYIPPIIIYKSPLLPDCIIAELLIRQRLSEYKIKNHSREFFKCHIEIIKNAIDEISQKQLSWLISAPIQGIPVVTEKSLQSNTIGLSQLLCENHPNITNINNNLVQMICVTDKHNYLDILTQIMGAESALSFAKKCSLSGIDEDCHLLEKIYLNQKNPSIQFTNNSCKQIEYLNNKKEIVVSSKKHLGKILADNLQYTYATSKINEFARDFVTEKISRHLEDLDKPSYHQIMMTRLSIPIKIKGADNKKLYHKII